MHGLDLVMAESANQQIYINALMYVCVSLSVVVYR